MTRPRPSAPSGDPASPPPRRDRPAPADLSLRPSSAAPAPAPTSATHLSSPPPSTAALDHLSPPPPSTAALDHLSSRPSSPAPRRPRAARPLLAILALAALLAPAAAAAAPIPRDLFRLAGPPEGYEPPALQNNAALTYPEELLQLPEPPSGTVVVRYVVGVDGIPKELEVTQSVHPELDRRALEAVAALRYTPGKLKGQPVEVTLAIGLEIAAPERRAPPTPPPPEATDPDKAPDEAPVDPAAAGPVRLAGNILPAGLRTPVEGATVLVVPAPADLPLGRVRQIVDDSAPPAWSLKAVTDAQGAFELRGVPSGRLRIIVLAQGYERVDQVDQLVDGQRLELTYFAKQLVFNPYKTVVKASRDDVGEVNRRTITLEEINALPGTQGDALKSIQNFPGVARAPFGAGLLAIRGAAPGDSATFLGYHEIPQLFHFGGLTSVFNSDILTQIDFIPGNFDSRYGDAIGGVINVSPRKGRRDGYHGYIDSDLFDTGVLAEGPVGKGSLILSGRRSYIDFVLKNAIPDDAGLNLTIAPRYYDYQVIFDYPISGGDFSARIFGSDDRTSLVFTAANEMQADQRDRFDTTVFFHRADLVYRKQLGAWEFLVTPSYRRDFASIALGDAARFDLTSNGFTGRAELARQIARRSGVRIGTEFSSFFYDFAITAPTFAGDPNTGGTGGLSATTKGTSNLLFPALYATSSIGIGERVTLYPGVRFTYYGTPFHRTTTDPRLRWNIAIGDRTNIKGGVGLYSQVPNPPFKWDAVFGNPKLGPEHALHTSLGIAREFDHDITLEVTAFYKYLWNLSAASTLLALRESGPAPEIWANTGTGNILGSEILFRKALSRSLFGWLSYTLMRSTRRDAPGQDSYLFDFDQTHILTAIASYKLPKGWQVGARFRLVSGNPTTAAYAGIYDASVGNYVPLTGPRNGARQPTFHQLDLRVDRRWVYKRISTTAYLDVLNIYNAQNAEFTNYSYNYQTSAPITSLPILPSIGLKLEW